MKKFAAFLLSSILAFNAYAQNLDSEMLPEEYIEINPIESKVSGKVLVALDSLDYDIDALMPIVDGLFKQYLIDSQTALPADDKASVLECSRLCQKEFGFEEYANSNYQMVMAANNSMIWKQYANHLLLEHFGGRFDELKEEVNALFDALLECYNNEYLLNDGSGSWLLAYDFNSEKNGALCTILSNVISDTPVECDTNISMNHFNKECDALKKYTYPDGERHPKEIEKLHKALKRWKEYRKSLLGKEAIGAEAKRLEWGLNNLERTIFINMKNRFNDMGMVADDNEALLLPDCTDAELFRFTYRPEQ